jgi:hypothetical protein
MRAADEIERLRAEVARLNTFLHPIGVVINQEVRGDDGYGSTQATNTWITSDGSVTNYDPNTEMGFWISALHNECDRSAHLEREIDDYLDDNDLIDSPLVDAPTSIREDVNDD